MLLILELLIQTLILLSSAPPGTRPLSALSTLPVIHGQILESQGLVSGLSRSIIFLLRLPLLGLCAGDLSGTFALLAGVTLLALVFLALRSVLIL